MSTAWAPDAMNNAVALAQSITKVLRIQFLPLLTWFLIVGQLTPKHRPDRSCLQSPIGKPDNAILVARSGILTLGFAHRRRLLRDEARAEFLQHELQEQS